MEHYYNLNDRDWIQNDSKPKSFAAQPFKDKEFAVNFYEQMVKARVLEEKLIKMAKSQDGFFWIGGPGEEAFNIALGMQVKKGMGIEHDYMHLHYRSNACVMAMGAPMISFLRQMKNTSTDPFSGGRNFSGHPCVKEWNIVPVTSTIETQYSVAPGTARAQMRARKEGKEHGITVVVGGDAGTAEGDFATSLIWSSRPGEELPMLMIVTNNKFGISTNYSEQHGEQNIADRAKAFGIEHKTVDGKNPEKIWKHIFESMDYVRNSGHPFVLEVNVSRLYGHSSSSGANRVEGEECPIESFEKKLKKLSWLDDAEIEKIWESARNEANLAHEQVRSEPQPRPESIQAHTFADGKKGGIPGRDF